jgi:hypothetical protein
MAAHAHFNVVALSGAAVFSKYLGDSGAARAAFSDAIHTIPNTPIILTIICLPSQKKPISGRFVKIHVSVFQGNKIKRCYCSTTSFF